MSGRPEDDGEARLRLVQSPCIGICVIDPGSGLCEGCLRTLDEVARWGASTAAEREEILDAVAAREAHLQSGDPAGGERRAG